MSKEKFKNSKSKLLQIIHKELNKKKNINEKETLQILEKAVKSYDFYNRFEMKGLLSRVVVDSLESEYAMLGNKIIEFDNSIR